MIGDRPWLSLPLPGRGFEIYSGSETHGVKVANLDGNVIPAPPHVVGVSIDHMDRVDMYSVSESHLVSLQRKSVPEMTSIHVTSEYVDRTLLAESFHTSLVLRTDDITSQLPDDASTDRFRQLAEQWTEGIPRGWLQVEAIETGLRRNYTVDRDARPSADSESPVADFLFESKRGPEYLFASSAACLLRSLGYATRLVSGFYAHPENYDTRKHHTAVMAADAHFWCEILIGSDAWITIDPSPGYELPGPPPGLIGSMLQTAYLIWLATVANAVPLTAAVLVAILLFAYRRKIRERLLTWHWRWSMGGTPQQRAVKLAALIDYRLLLTGQQRPASTTLLRWSKRRELMHVQGTLQRLATAATAARFAPTNNETHEPANATKSETQRKELMILEHQLSVRVFRCPISVGTAHGNLAAR